MYRLGRGEIGVVDRGDGLELWCGRTGRDLSSTPVGDRGSEATRLHRAETFAVTGDGRS